MKTVCCLVALVLFVIGCGRNVHADRSSQPNDFITRELLRKIPIQGGRLYVYYTRTVTVTHPPVMVFVPSTKDTPTQECR